MYIYIYIHTHIIHVHIFSGIWKHPYKPIYTFIHTHYTCVHIKWDLCGFSELAHVPPYFLSLSNLVSFDTYHRSFSLLKQLPSSSVPQPGIRVLIITLLLMHYFFIFTVSVHYYFCCIALITRVEFASPLQLPKLPVGQQGLESCSSRSGFRGRRDYDRAGQLPRTFINIWLSFDSLSTFS